MSGNSTANRVEPTGKRPAARHTYLFEDVPDELIAIRAYEKWQVYCVMMGRVVHGRDREDWLEAEAELERFWSGLVPSDVEAFKNAVPASSLTPSPDRIAIRAYYLSQSTGASTQEDALKCWKSAEAEEILILLARAFLDFHSQRHTAPSRPGQLVGGY